MRTPESDELKDERSRRLSRILVDHVLNLSGSSSTKESRSDKLIGILGMTIAGIFMLIMLILALGVLVWVILFTYLMIDELVKLVF